MGSVSTVILAFFWTVFPYNSAVERVCVVLTLAVHSLFVSVQCVVVACPAVTKGVYVGGLTVKPQWS
jgi:hypothetical protein